MTEFAPKLVRLDPLRLRMSRQGQMVTDATIFASDAINLEPDAVRQLYDAASLPPAKKILATADIHVGFGIPIGAVLGMENAIMPAAVGYDINCGVGLGFRCARTVQDDGVLQARTFYMDALINMGAEKYPQAMEAIEKALMQDGTNAEYAQLKIMIKKQIP